jgi:hypothetical protein
MRNLYYANVSNIAREGCYDKLWSNFLSLYSQFYEVIILKGTYAIGEGKKIKNANCILNVKLRL